MVMRRIERKGEVRASAAPNNLKLKHKCRFYVTFDLRLPQSIGVFGNQSKPNWSGMAAIHHTFGYVLRIAADAVAAASARTKSILTRTSGYSINFYCFTALSRKLFLRPNCVVQQQASRGFQCNICIALSFNMLRSCLLYTSPSPRDRG